MVAFSSNHFGGSIAWRSTGSLESLVFFIKIGETKVNNPQSVVVVEQKIFRFEISVADTALVQILDAADEFSINFGCLLFLETGVSDDEIKQLATVSILHNHKQFLVSFYDLQPKKVMLNPRLDLPRRVGWRWGGELSWEFWFLWWCVQHPFSRLFFPSQEFWQQPKF